ncbi:MAG: hypothetical protein ACE5GD_10760 [Candidatus Geothermarchaeales archaeon]
MTAAIVVIVSAYVILLTPIEPTSAPPIPFECKFDTELSHGFEEMYLTHGTFGASVFVSPRGGSGTIVAVVTSNSDLTWDLNLSMGPLPPGVTVTIDRPRVTLEPRGRIRAELIVEVSPTAPTTTPGLPPTIPATNVWVNISGLEVERRSEVQGAFGFLLVIK